VVAWTVSARAANRAALDFSVVVLDGNGLELVEVVAPSS
jgi:hypothetical protein